MSETILSIFRSFCNISRLDAQFTYDELLMKTILLCIGILMCFGICLYREATAVYVFFGFATSVILLFRNHMRWGYLVTLFVVLGVLISLIIRNRNFVAAVLISMITSGVVIYSVSHSIVLTIVVMVVAGGIAVLVPVESVCIFTAFSGSLLVVDVFKELNTLLFIPIFAVSIGIQIFFSTKIKYFDERYPKWTKKIFGKRRKKIEAGA